MSAKQLPENELSRVIAEDALTKGPMVLEVTASAGERESLARRFDLLECRSLEARVRMRPNAKGTLVTMTADISALVVQPCVLSLKPVTSEVRESFELLLTLQAEETDGGEVVIDPDGPDPAEPVGPEGCDIGEILAQQLAVLLDPYPRHLEAEQLAGACGDESRDSNGSSSPFTVLKVLKEGS